MKPVTWHPSLNAQYGNHNKRYILYLLAKCCTSTLRVCWRHFVNDACSLPLPPKGLVFQRHGRGSQRDHSWKQPFSQPGLPGTLDRFSAPRGLLHESAPSGIPAFNGIDSSPSKKSTEAGFFPKKEATPLGICPQPSSLTLRTSHMNLRTALYSELGFRSDHD